jgi:hypothetical protein
MRCVTISASFCYVITSTFSLARTMEHSHLYWQCEYDSDPVLQDLAHLPLEVVRKAAIVSHTQAVANIISDTQRADAITH